MANGLSATASIPTYTADGFTGSGTLRELTFSGPAPSPDDGLIAIILDIAGLSYAAGPFGAPSQRLAYYCVNPSGFAQVSGGSGFTEVVVGGFSFLADA